MADLRWTNEPFSESIVSAITSAKITPTSIEINLSRRADLRTAYILEEEADQMMSGDLG
jgi:hypothetical protein